MKFLFNQRRGISEAEAERERQSDKVTGSEWEGARVSNWDRQPVDVFYVAFAVCVPQNNNN